MKRYLLAVVLAIASAPTASAQFPVIPPPPPVAEVRPPFPPYHWMFAGPPGVLLYDSGEYLLGGTQGQARVTGGFTMEFPNGSGFHAGSGATAVGPVTSGYCPPRGRFHRR
jgi:hypothetical protein